MVKIDDFVEKLKKYREINKLNYSEAATELGVSTSTLILWEKKIFKPRWDKYAAVMAKIEAGNASQA